MQGKQELKVSHCFCSFSFLSPCCWKLLVATAAKKLKWSKAEMVKDSWACPARGWSHWPCSSTGSNLSLQHARKCVAGLEPKCLGLTGWSCKIHRFMESQARGKLCNHLFWPVMGLTEAKWKPPVPSCVCKWQCMSSPGKQSSTYHHC